MAAITLAQLRAQRGTTNSMPSVEPYKVPSVLSTASNVSQTALTLSQLSNAVRALDSGFNHVALTDLFAYLAQRGYSREQVVSTVQAARRAGTYALEPEEGRYGSTAVARECAIDGCHYLMRRQG